MEDCNEEPIPIQSESIYFAVTRMRRLESLLCHMKRRAPHSAMIDLDAALDYAKEAISELS